MSLRRRIDQLGVKVQKLPPVPHPTAEIDRERLLQRIQVAEQWMQRLGEVELAALSEDKRLRIARIREILAVAHARKAQSEGKATGNR